jgi:hypothetical protein
MKKILLVENRQSRQEQFLPNGAADVEKMKELPNLKNIIGDSFTDFIDMVKQSDKLDELLPYDLLIFHRSVLGEHKLLNKIQSFAKENSKNLIYFSGGITQNIYSEDEFPFLLINSKDFYSPNLISFFVKYSESKINLLWLLYKDNWLLTYLYKYRQILLGVKFPGGEETKDLIESIIGKKDLKEINKMLEEIYLKS